MDKATWKVTLILFSLIWLCVLVINVFRTEATRVPQSIVQQVKDSGLIEEATIGPTEIVFTLKEPISIRLEVGQVQTEVISTIRNDSTSQLIHDLSADGVIIHISENAEPAARGDWVFIAFLVAGFAILIVKAKRDLRGGSVRQQIADLKDAFDRGEIDRDEFTRKINDLTPYL